MFIPVLPPMEESTCDNSVVGMLMNFIPRLKRLAANPTISPVIPPPIAIKQSCRVKLFFNKISKI